MAVNRFYSSTAAETTLTGGISNSATTMVVASVSGFPVSYPYTLVIDKDTTNEEIVTVSEASGTTLTLSARGADGSLATTHSAGAVVTHMATARDFREPQEHIAAEQNVHGIGSGSAVVGTATAQTLTNKTIDAAANTITNLVQANVGGLVAALAAKAVDTEVVKLAGTQTVTGAKTFSATTTLSGAVTASGAVTSTGGLTIDGVDPLNPPRCHLKRTVAQAISSGGSAEVVVWDEETTDPTGMHSPSGTRITIATPGLYSIRGSAFFETSGTGLRIVSIRVNAAGSPTGGGLLVQSPPYAVQSFACPVAATAEAYLDAGDYIEMFAYQTSGGDLDIRADSTGYLNYLAARWVGQL